MAEKRKRRISLGVSTLLFLFFFSSLTLAQGEEQKALSILLTNDDGIEAPGLMTLYEELASIAKVTVVAPQEDKSGIGQAITIRTPLRLKEVSGDGKLWGYALNGTPSDCVKFGLSKLLKERPDIVISGINKGANPGLAVFYSGTVAGAREGAMHGIPAIAVSLATRKETSDYGYAAKFTKNLALLVKQKGIPPGVLLNVNIPAKSGDEINGVAVIRQGLENLPFDYEERKDPAQRPYYWPALRFHLLKAGPETDVGTVAKDMISITPLQLDLTRYDLMEKIRQWNFE
ncbi:MAG: 5'/3'-nucleotidase SurE [Candidatus Binatia bacterium]